MIYSLTYKHALHASTFSPPLVPHSSRKDLDYSIAPSAYNPLAVLAPDTRAHAFASHHTVTGDFLDA